MTEISPLTRAASVAQVMTATLCLGSSVDLWSLALVVVALLGVLTSNLTPIVIACLMASVGAGAMQKFFAVRVALDARLFAYWAQDWSVARGASLNLEAQLALLDESLLTCGLIAKAPEWQRNLPSRAAGARGLLLRQLGALGVQLLLLLVVLGLLWAES